MHFRQYDRQGTHAKMHFRHDCQATYAKMHYQLLESYMKKEKSSPVLSNEERWFSCEDSFLKVFLKTTNGMYIRTFYRVFKKYSKLDK